jgi:nitrite reductase/ring-hydroxylating ferredoxin subunit
LGQEEDAILSREDNELVTQVGPETPMGDLMRQYWMPALLSSELPRPDCDPVRVLLLGERLVAFRDSQGNVGLMDHFCPHRGASLYFGRNEEGGIRCVYHGWKFDHTGRCVDMPNEPPKSTFKDKVRARAYPCVERAGLVWTYMGPRETPPAMPHFEVFDGTPEDTVCSAYLVQCNYLQAMEGDQDPTHFGFLHAGHARAEDAPPGSKLRLTLEQRAPHYKILDTPGGVLCGTYRPMPESGQVSWSVSNFVMPFYTLTGVGVGPGAGAGYTAKRAGLLCRVPMDDHHTMAFLINVGLSDQSDAAPKNAGISKAEYTALPLLPNTSGWYGRFRWVPDAGNDYMIDRGQQARSESYTGIPGVILEDIAVTESMGPVYDRPREHLGSADTYTIRVRRRLIAAAKALAEDGTAPQGVDDPEAALIRSGTIDLPEGSTAADAVEALRLGWNELPELTPLELEAAAGRS